MRFESAGPARQRGASTLLIISLVLAFLVIAGGLAVATLYFTGMLGGGGSDAVAAEAAEAEPEAPKPPIYLPLEPPMVVNFERKGRVGYLQVSIEVMSRDQAAIDAVRLHMPVVRNNLLLLMSGKSYEELETREEKDALRDEALAEINRVLDERSIEADVEAVYFTAFVMQ
jgi:flagellar FliL protein